YFVQALDLMYAHLTDNAPLPPSQLVRTVPRGGTAGSAPAITTSNVPPIAPNPPGADTITFSDRVLQIPQ
ncbi:MAG: 3-hydroxybutyrate oligomer hydrolase family protein, partial [Myxococcaceae bacterium]